MKRPRELKGITFADFADKWLAEQAKVRVKPTTYQGYESNIRAHLSMGDVATYDTL